MFGGVAFGSAPFAGELTTPASGTVSPSFIASVTSVHAPTLPPQVNAPFIASVTAVYAPTFKRPTPAAAWVNEAPSGLPSIRGEVGACYFPPLGKTVFFGGWNGTTYYNGTYTYDAATNTFASLSTTHSPSARWAAGQMAYDANRGKIVLFGGYGGSFLAETWEFDGTDWTQITTTHSPSAREQGAMAFDQTNNKIVFYSGATATTFPDETWTYDGTDWTQQSPTHTPGTLNSNGGHGRYEHKMCWDPLSGSLLMVGGYVNGTGTPDTHVYHWDGTDWTSSTPSHPITVAQPGMTNNGSTVVVWSDGYTQSGNAYQWDGSDWVTYFNDGGNPPVRGQSELAYDPTAGPAGAIIAAFGQGLSSAYLSDLWLLFNPATTRGQPLTLYYPTSYDSTESNGVSQLVNAFNVNGTSAEIGPFFGLSASGMYAMEITPDGALGIVTEIQVNTVSTAGKCWVVPMASPENYTEITLSETQPRGVTIVPKAGGGWLALVCGNGVWVGGHHSFGTVDVVDMSAATPSIIKTVSTSGVYPVFVRATSDAATAVVMDGGTDGLHLSVYTIDLTGSVSGWALSAGPTVSGATHNCQDIVISPDDSYAWFSEAGSLAGGSDVVRPLNLSTMTFASPISISDPPGPFAISPDSSKLWLGCSNDKKLFRIDTASKAIDHTTSFTGTSGAGTSTYPVSMSPDGTTLYWAEGGPPGHLWAMDTVALTPVDTGLKIPGYGSYVAGQGSFLAGLGVPPFIASTTVVYAPTITFPSVATAFIASNTVVYTPTMAPGETFAPFIGSVTSVYTPSLGLSNSITVSVAGTYTWLCPPGISTVYVQAYGGGGGGGGSSVVTGSGGGGGAFAARAAVPVTPGTLYTFTVGAAGGSQAGGGDSTFTGDSSTQVIAKGGGAGVHAGASVGAGGAASGSTGDTGLKFSGGDGGLGTAFSGPGGGGGASGNTLATGNNGASSGAGGAGGAGANGGGSGGDGNTTGHSPGGGGGGNGGTDQPGLAGADGEITITTGSVFTAFIGSVTVVYTPTLEALSFPAPFIPSVTVVYAPTVQYDYVEPPFIASHTVVYQPTLKVAFTGAGVSQLVLEVLTSDPNANANVSQVTLEILVPWYDGLHIWEKTGQTGG